MTALDPQRIIKTKGGPPSTGSADKYSDARKDFAAAKLRSLLPLLEETYGEGNCRARISPDPLELVLPYEKPEDREVAAFLASCLAYGRVAQIVKSASCILKALGPFPAAFLKESSPVHLRSLCPSFRHRFTSGEEMGGLLAALGQILRNGGGIEGFLGECAEKTTDLMEALSLFSRELRRRAGMKGTFLLPSPADGSACKRLFLFLKWMVRHDDVDPGGWTLLSPAHLVIPLDVHMFRLCSALGLTARRQPDLKTAVEVTEVFRSVLPSDPLKYDFVLTRFGIRQEMNEQVFIQKCLEGQKNEDPHQILP